MAVQLQAALITAGAVVLGLLVQAVLALRTLNQRRRSDDREAQWARIQWAVERTLDVTPAAQEIGAAALYRIIDEPHLEARDRDVVEAALSELLARQDDAIDLRLAQVEAAEEREAALEGYGQDEDEQDAPAPPDGEDDGHGSVPR